MRLLRLSEVPIDPKDRVHRHGRLGALAAWLAGFGAVAAMFYFASQWGAKPLYFFGTLTLLFVLLMRRFVTARFHPSNWLVRERIQTPDPAHPGVSQTQYLRHVELELAGDVAPLAAALQAERIHKAPLQEHWYGSSSTLYEDYPLSMTPPSLRIRWDVVPGASQFLKFLGSQIRIGDAVTLTSDFTNVQSLSVGEQQKKLRELATRGQTITAVYIARRLYGCGLAEAKTMVEGLVGGSREPRP